MIQGRITPDFPLLTRLASCGRWWFACGMWLSLVVTSPCWAQGPGQPAAKKTQTVPANPQPEAPSSELPEKIDPAHPLVPVLKIAYQSRHVLANVQDYSGVFIKREVINGTLVTHQMEIKIREEPFSVYMKFLNQPYTGREVLFVAGANQNRLMVHETGLKSIAGTLSLAPTDQLAMAENRHPITQVGMSQMLEGVIKQWENEGLYGEIEVKYYPEAKLGEHPCRVLESSHPIRRRQFPFHLTRLYLDGKTLLPVRVEQIDWPARAGEKPIAVETYMYSNVRTNIGLTNADFDRRNPAYQFK